MWFSPHDSKKLTAEIPDNKLPAPKPVFFINFLRFIIIYFLLIAWIADGYSLGSRNTSSWVTVQEMQAMGITNTKS